MRQPEEPRLATSPSLSESELRDLLVLTMVSGVGPHTCQALLERFKTPGRILDASVSSLRDVPGVGPKVAAKIGLARQEIDGQAELDLCRARGVDLIPRGGPPSPPSLAEMPDPPGLLCALGASAPRAPLAIALVDSRRCTPYGARIAVRLA